MATVACPRSSWTSLGWVPCESSKVAQVCRRSWKQMSGSPARLRRGLKERLRRFEGLMRRFGRAPTRHFARYLGQPCRRYPREETQEPLRRRAADTQEVEERTPDYRAMLHLVRGVR